MAKYFKKGAQLERMADGLTRQLQRELSPEEKDDLTPEEIAALSPEEFRPHVFNAREAENTGYSNYSYWRCTFQAFWKNRLARVLLIALCALLVFTFIQPLLPNQKPSDEIYNTVDQYDTETPMRNKAPSREFWFGTDAVGYKNYGLPKPGAMLLGYPVNTFLEFKPVYNILLDPGVCKQRYYKMTLSDYITPDYPPTYHWYGKNDLTLMTMCWSAQGPVLEKALARNHVTHIYHVYDDAPHAVAAGKGTDAEGWLNEAAAFWEEQVG